MENCSDSNIIQKFKNIIQTLLKTKKCKIFSIGVGAQPFVF